MRREAVLRLDDRFTCILQVRDTVVLVGDTDSVLLDGDIAADVVLAMDGTRTAPDIADHLRGQHPAEVVHYVVLGMLRSGLAQEVATAPPDPARLPRDLADGPRALRGAWRERGGGPVAVGRFLDDVVVMTDDVLDPVVDAAIDSLREASFILARVGRGNIWVGPRIGPTDSCLDCLRSRVRLNLTAQALVHGGSFDDEVMIRRIARPLEDEVFERLAEALSVHAGNRDLTGALLVFGPDQNPAVHRVARLPQCPACGDPSIAPPGPDVSLASRPREGRSGGGYRLVDPSETVTRYSGLVSPITGVVRHLRKVEASDSGLMHIYTASHAHSRGPTSVRAVRDDRRDHTGGKGRTDIDARASALCESLERYSGMYRGSEPHRYARRSALPADTLAPNDLMLFSDSQYEYRDPWNAAQTGHFQLIPEPYDDEKIEWSPVRSLTTGYERMVPTAALFLGFEGEGRRYCSGDSNGLAAGNCVEEAILQGFLELAERDAIAIWWYNRLPRPAVALASMEDDWIHATLVHYDGLGRRVWALDITTDLGIPTVVAISERVDPPADIIFGFGAHLDPALATVRALTELNQMLPTVLQPMNIRRRQLMPDFADAIRWWEEATVDEHPYLRPSPGVRAEPWRPPSPTADLRDDVLDCVRRADGIGVEVLVHDLTRADVGLPVVKVLAPGMRHFWRRLGPGRIYDTPVSLGWLPSPVLERDMNPVSMFV